MFGRGGGGSLLDRLCSYGELGMGSNVIRKSSQRNQNAGPVVSKCEAVGVGFGVVEADARQALTRVFYARGALVWDDRTWGELLMRWFRSFSLMALGRRAEAESRYRRRVVCRAQIGFWPLPERFRTRDCRARTWQPKGLLAPALGELGVLSKGDAGAGETAKATRQRGGVCGRGKAEQRRSGVSEKSVVSARNVTRGPSAGSEV